MLNFRVTYSKKAGQIMVIDEKENPVLVSLNFDKQQIVAEIAKVLTAKNCEWRSAKGIRPEDKIRPEDIILIFEDERLQPIPRPLPQKKEIIEKKTRTIKLTFSEESGLIIAIDEKKQKLRWFENFELEHIKKILAQILTEQNHKWKLHQQIFPEDITLIIDPKLTDSIKG